MPRRRRAAREPAVMRHRQETEKGLQAAIIQLAQVYGFRVYHPFWSLKSTPGWPDLCLLKGGVDGQPGQMLMLEVKSATGVLTPAQQEWLALLATVPGVRAMVVRPNDWDTIAALLRGEPCTST